MSSSGSEDEHSARPNVAVQKVGVLARIGTFLFGNDVFISYSRSDAAAYALAKADWFSSIRGLALTEGTLEALHKEKPNSVQLQGGDLCEN